MRKIVNFRASLFAVVGVILGILSFYEMLFGNFWFLTVVALLVGVSGVTALIIKSRSWRTAVFVLVFIAVGYGVAQLSYSSVNGKEELYREAEISGRVTDIDRNGGESYVFYLENCSSSDGIDYRGRIRVYLFEKDLDINTGDEVTVKGLIGSFYPVKSSADTGRLRQDLRYEIRDATLLSKKAGKLKPDEIVRNYVYDTVHKHMPDNADLAYSLLTGDRNSLSDEIKASFSRSGIIHLLAVSGLHVGFIVAAFGFILKKFRLSAVWEGIVLLIPLIAYAYICGFTPSVTRAVIMTACGYVARIVYGRYDLLTSLSWAALIILLFSPFYLFDVGFQLSVLSVYGIATVYSAVGRSLSKRRLHFAVKYLVNSLLISTSCSLSTLFTVVVNYGKIPTLGILVNVVAIPLVSVAFIICMIGMLPWIFRYVMWLADKILLLVVKLAAAVSRFSFATASFTALAVSAAVVAAWFFVLGGYVNFKKSGKIVVNSVCAAVLALCVGLAFVKQPCQTQAFVSFGYQDAMCVSVSPDGSAVIVGKFNDEYAASNAIKYAEKLKITNCNLYFADYSSAYNGIVEEFTDRLPVAKAYVLDQSSNEGVSELLSSNGVQVVRQIRNTVTGDSVTVRSVYDGVLSGAVVTCGELTIALTYGSDIIVDNFCQTVDYADVYVLQKASEAYSRAELTTLTPYQSPYLHNYGSNKYGNFTITQNGDRIKMTFR